MIVDKLLKKRVVDVVKKINRIVMVKVVLEDKVSNMYKGASIRVRICVGKLRILRPE